MQTVCILAAGKGTRLGQKTQGFNKATLPLGPKAVISHIMAQFNITETQFIIATGYLSEQVHDYISLAHQSANVEFVSVDNFENPGSGPGYSLLCCSEYLQKPFFMIAVDTLFEYDLNKITKEENWVGVAQVAEENSSEYCNFALDENEYVVSIHDKERQTDPFAFIGLMYIYDYQNFWKGLEQKRVVSGEHQVSDGIGELIKTSGVKAISMPWVDIGNLDGFTEAGKKFYAFDFSKVDEAIYFSGNRVIKMFVNPTLITNRVKKARLHPGIFPEIKDVRKQMYSYDFVPGKTLYEVNDPFIFAAFLDFMDKEVWTEVTIDKIEMLELTENFYLKKTMDRIDLFSKKFDNFIEPIFINSEKADPVEKLLDSVPWNELYDGKAVFMHGDLQFDNILFDQDKNRFTLIDWRQDFSGRVDVGDIYYDLAKLNGGILLNYDFVKRGYLIYREEENGAVVDFPTRFLAEEYKRLLSSYCKKKGYSFKKVEILTGLIFLNMAPLHEPPFDKALHALGRIKLMEALSG